MNWFLILSGVALLFFGRKIFWMFTGILGFFLGMTVAPQLIPGLTQTMVLIIALIIGFLSALLAIFIQKLTVRLAGFTAGGYLAYYLLQMFSINIGSLVWVVVILVGIIGAFLAGVMLDWTLVFLSSGIGSAILVENLKIPQQFILASFVALLILGIALQSASRKR